MGEDSPARAENTAGPAYPAGYGNSAGGREAIEMLTVDRYELIQRKHLVDERGRRAVAHELGHGRSTVAKAIANPSRRGIESRSPAPNLPAC